MSVKLTKVLFTKGSTQIHWPPTTFNLYFSLLAFISKVLLMGSHSEIQAWTKPDR